MRNPSLIASGTLITENRQIRFSKFEKIVVRYKKWLRKLEFHCPALFGCLTFFDSIESANLRDCSYFGRSNIKW